MPEIRYGGIYRESSAATVTTMGSSAGPPGGDGWQIVARLPASLLPVGTTRLAVLCRGIMADVVVSGASPARGLMQLCLGLESGLRAPNHLQNVSLRGEQLTPQPGLDGLPFCFLMIQSPDGLTITDPSFGAAWFNDSDAEICLWARTYWNGDGAVYAAEWTLRDVEWLWFDLDHIPSTDRYVERYLPASPVTVGKSQSAWPTNYLNANTVGVAGQKWLHVVQVEYTPQQENGLAPGFQFGYSPTPGSLVGFVPKIGTNEKWGLARAATNQTGLQDVRLHGGGFWYQERPSGVFLPAMQCRDWNLSGAGVLLHRFHYLGIRLDNLLDVLARTETSFPNAGAGLLHVNPAAYEVFVPLERTATGVVAAPSLLVHGCVEHVGLESAAAEVRSDQGSAFRGFEGFSRLDNGKREGHGVMGFTDQAFTYATPDLQYRVHFTGGLGNGAGGRTVRDLTILQAYLLRDPSNLPTDPPAIPDPLLVTVGAEGPDPATLPLLPLQPDAQLRQDVEGYREAVIGGKYRRSWPLFTKPRRVWSLRWEPLSVAQKDTLLAFLEANQTFAFRVPHAIPSDPLVAVMQPDLAEYEQIGGDNWAVAARIVELIWTQ